MTPWHAPFGSICQWWLCACIPGVTQDDKYCKPVKQHEHNKTPAFLWCSGLHINRRGIGWQQLETTRVMRDTQPPPHPHTFGISRQNCHITIIPHCNRQIPQQENAERERRTNCYQDCTATRYPPVNLVARAPQLHTRKYVEQHEPPYACAGGTHRSGRWRQQKSSDGQLI